MKKPKQEELLERTISRSKQTLWTWTSICSSLSQGSYIPDVMTSQYYRMAYIEENIKKRKGDTATKPKKDEGPRDPYEELYRITDRFNGQKAADEEGSVTNSLAMLTAIPEVDLGME